MDKKGEKLMKIAIPTENGVLCPHFGHCQVFTIIDVDSAAKKIESVNVLDPPQHERGILPAWLGELGCTHIIAGGMGGRAMALFQQNGVQVIYGSPSQKPEALVMAYLNDELEIGDNLCDEPGFERHGQRNCGHH
jgi:ATP-binding protein involved in chromosome partitioning